MCGEVTWHAGRAGLTRMETLAAFTSNSASPALVDNETMRNTIDSLEETTSDFLFDIPWDWTLFPFILTLICFCCLVFFCGTADVSFAVMIQVRTAGARSEARASKPGRLR